jgi:hypothetical protein
MAWLSSGNQVGFEIFEYIEPKAQRRKDNFEYWKSGFIHICITDPNIEDLCNRISESGGKQRSKIWEIVPDKGHKIVFCEDPFGNMIEIYSRLCHEFDRHILVMLYCSYYLYVSSIQIIHFNLINLSNYRIKKKSYACRRLY